MWIWSNNAPNGKIRAKKDFSLEEKSVLWIFNWICCLEYMCMTCELKLSKLNVWNRAMNPSPICELAFQEKHLDQYYNHIIVTLHYTKFSHHLIFTIWKQSEKKCLEHSMVPKLSDTLCKNQERIFISL